MSINIIAAMAKNGVIGRGNKLPWHIPQDLKQFKRLTTKKNSAVVMGRKTWESLPIKPLPDRVNYVLTKNNFHATFSDGLVLKEPDDILILKSMYQNIWIIGGQSLYEYYIDKPYVDRIYLTEIKQYYEGDTFFPKIPEKFYKTTRGESKTYKINAVKFGNFNMNIYSNCCYQRNYIS
jgi:dihydrofolate reductase